MEKCHDINYTPPCSEYKEQNKCPTTDAGNEDSGRCVWNSNFDWNNRCYPRDTEPPQPLSGKILPYTRCEW